MKTIERIVLVVALVVALLGLLLPSQAPQSAPTAAGSQALTFGTSNFGGSVSIAGSLTVAGKTQYPVVYFGTDAINGTMLAHGLAGAPTYPACMVYNAGFVTVTAQISAANATSVTFRLFDAAGSPWTGTPLAVRCSAVYVP